MPVEIRELVIRAIVEPRRSGGRASGADDAPGDDAPSPEPLHDPGRLVQDCVREVMRILAAQKER
jgi:hypothetical protein